MDCSRLPRTVVAACWLVFWVGRSSAQTPVLADLGETLKVQRCLNGFFEGDTPAPAPVVTGTAAAPSSTEQPAKSPAEAALDYLLDEIDEEERLQESLREPEEGSASRQDAEREAAVRESVVRKSQEAVTALEAVLKDEQRLEAEAEKIDRFCRSVLRSDPAAWGVLQEAYFKSLRRCRRFLGDTGQETAPPPSPPPPRDRGCLLR